MGQNYRTESFLSSLEKGGKAAPFWIAGLCVLEDRDTITTVAREVKRISETLKTPMVFKASFDKANRTSSDSPRGPGMEEGLRLLEWVKKEFELPIVSDIHEASQAVAVAEVADILQIPAFLCRQTDLIAAACRTGRPVNVKKGQFLSPSNVGQLLNKLQHFGAKASWITERGVSFGYQRLVVDFVGFEEMERLGAKIILDITHSVQVIGGQGTTSGGIRAAIPYLARAGAAVGVTGFFAETHPDPSRAWSDGANAWPLSELEGLVRKTRQIAEATHG